MFPPLARKPAILKVKNQGLAGESQWRVGPVLFAPETQVDYRGTLYITPAAIPRSRTVRLCSISTGNDGSRSIAGHSTFWTTSARRRLIHTQRFNAG